MKSVGATGARVVAIYLAEVLLLAASAPLIGLAARRGAAVRDRRRFGAVMPLPIAPSVHPARSALGARSTACSPPSPSRCGRSAAPMTCRCRRCSATRSRRSGALPRRRYIVAVAVAGRGALAGARGRGRLRPADRRCSSSARRSRCSAMLRLVAGCVMAVGAPAAAAALDRAAARDRQHPPAGRADADRGAVARPRRSRCWSPCSRSTAICAGSSRRRCRRRRRRFIFSTFRPPMRARFDAFVRRQAPTRDARTRADAARAHRRGARRRRPRN